MTKIDPEFYIHLHFVNVIFLLCFPSKKFPVCFNLSTAYISIIIRIRLYHFHVVCHCVFNYCPHLGYSNYGN